MTLALALQYAHYVFTEYLCLQQCRVVLRRVHKQLLGEGQHTEVNHPHCTLGDLSPTPNTPALRALVEHRLAFICRAQLHCVKLHALVAALGAGLIHLHEAGTTARVSMQVPEPGGTAFALAVPSPCAYSMPLPLLVACPSAAPRLCCS